MKILKLVVIFMIAVLLPTSCYVVDRFQGTAVDYYLQNNTTHDLFYKLEGAPTNRVSEGTVEPGKRVLVAWTTGLEVSGPCFKIIRVYNLPTMELVLENNKYTDTSGIWVSETISEHKHMSTLTITEEMCP